MGEAKTKGPAGARTPIRELEVRALTANPGPEATEAELRLELGKAVLYVEGMRIVPGGVRDRLRRQWRKLLGWELP